MGLSEDEEFELLSLEREKNKHSSFQDKAEEYGQKALGFAKKAANDPLAQLGINIASGDAPSALLAAKGMAQNPAEAVRSPTVQAGLPIAGGALAGFPGAAGGEAARQMLGTAFAPETVPKTTLGRAASMLGAGVAQDPAAIPGVPQISEMASGMLSKVGKGLARAGETLSGVKRDVLTQAAKQGLSTYGAPSLAKASQVFGEALGPEGREAMKVPASEAFDSALTRARGIASDIGAKVEKGDPVSAIDALKARQATDRIISSTPVTDKLARKNLYDWRSKFDDALEGQSGKLKDASTVYRQALVKDKILNPTRLNKSGEPSAFLPMLIGHGMMGKGVEGGLGMLTGTSPAVWGLGATAGGSAAKAINSIAENPAARQVLLQVLQRLTQNKQEAP